MEDSKAFCEFLSNRKPPRSLSESTPDDAVDFLRSLSSDRKLHEGYESETSPATSSVQGFFTLGRPFLKGRVKEQKESGKKKLHEGYESDNVLPNPTSPATSSVKGLSTLGQRDNVLPDQTSSEMLELREKLEEDETLLQLRLFEHSNTGSYPILVIFCGDNQDSEETYFISYIFNELCLRGFTPLRYDLTRSTVRDPEMLYSCCVGILIFSEKSARSIECLDGFVAIMDHLKANKLELIPLLFKVNLSDVMNQSNSFWESVPAPQALKWCEAMMDVFIKGYHQYMKGQIDFSLLSVGHNLSV